MQDFHSRKLSDENWYPGNVLLITNERKKSLVTVLDLLLASIDLFEYMDIRPFFTDNLDFFIGPAANTSHNR
ncbi:MAG: hypothetical protein HWD59_00365 [Coxiellaceae bacterium]|nr:MAG: hypothetical protein HWD59_00365 [Coxiellaceae bacterium]